MQSRASIHVSTAASYQARAAIAAVFIKISNVSSIPSRVQLRPWQTINDGWLKKGVPFYDNTMVWGWFGGKAVRYNMHAGIGTVDVRYIHS